VAFVRQSRAYETNLTRSGRDWVHDPDLLSRPFERIPRPFPCPKQLNFAKQKRRNPPADQTQPFAPVGVTTPVDSLRTEPCSSSTGVQRRPGDGTDVPKSVETDLAIHRPMLSSDNKFSSVSISQESNTHHVLSSAPRQASQPCSLTSLKGCVVSTPFHSLQNGFSFSGLTIKSVSGSLLQCGLVSGPAHITAVEQSTIVITCGQFRMHECKNVDVYLSCSSRPIIEDCDGIRFSPLPEAYVGLS
jgi:tubulin-specific chaperone C